MYSPTYYKYIAELCIYNIFDITKQDYLEADVTL